MAATSARFRHALGQVTPQDGAVPEGRGDGADAAALPEVRVAAHALVVRVAAAPRVGAAREEDGLAEAAAAVVDTPRRTRRQARVERRPCTHAFPCSVSVIRCGALSAGPM